MVQVTLKLYLLVIYLVVLNAQEEYYDRRFDYYDIDNLVQHPRLLKKYLDCFLEQGPCTPIGRVFRQLLPEIVQTACKKCSPPQKRLSYKAFNAFKRFYPESHDQLMRKLDPKGKYYTTFMKVISTN